MAAKKRKKKMLTDKQRGQLIDYYTKQSVRTLASMIVELEESMGGPFAIEFDDE